MYLEGNLEPPQTEKYPDHGPDDANIISLDIVKGLLFKPLTRSCIA